MELLQSLAVAALCVGLVYVLFSRQISSLRRDRDTALQELARERESGATVVGDLATWRERAAGAQRLQDELDETRTAKGQVEATLHGLRATLQAREDELERQKTSGAALQNSLNALRNELDGLRNSTTQAQAHLQHSERANEELRKYIDDARGKLSEAFADLAGKAFDEKSRNAADQSQKDLDALLKPFSENLKGFRERIDTLYSDEAKERSELAGAVNQLRMLNTDMAAQAAALTRALKGSAKVRGDWGELMLESVLRSSGLEEGAHYDRQKANVDDEGLRLQPDIVVKLPGDDRRVVIDSKVNLIAWQEAMNADTPEAQTIAMRRHAAALRQHVKDLGERNYPKAVGDSALEITIAFVPIEGALSAALGTDDLLQTYAFERKVVLASPNTLMAVLRVVERLWTRDKIQRQALDISDMGGRVLDALLGFISEFDEVGSKLKGASDAFTHARGRLSESTQAVIPRARKLVELGVRGKKALSTELTPETPVIALLSALQEGPSDQIP